MQLQHKQYRCLAGMSYSKDTKGRIISTYFCEDGILLSFQRSKNLNLEVEKGIRKDKGGRYTLWIRKLVLF